ncbi:MAG: RNA pseudouridine synthase [Spirochaeta sp.]|nr:RNA pseudouridine synthase [Spirochaeta sp.]
MGKLLQPAVLLFAPGVGRRCGGGAWTLLTLLACGAHALRPAIPIVAEGPDYLVVHKPAGVPCHRRDDQPGILELVDSADDLKLAHRLDDGTSGCLVLAKGRRAAAAIGDAFAAKRVAKVYVGLTASRPSKKKGVIVGDMVRSRRSQWRLTRDSANPACTCLSRSIGLGPSEGGDPAARLIVARPITGKTHQIRVATKSIGAPLLGDGLYGGGKADRLYLHAAAIRIPDVGLDARALPDSGASFLSRRFADAWSAVDLEAELADDALPRAAREFLERRRMS